MDGGGLALRRRLRAGSMAIETAIGYDEPSEGAPWMGMIEGREGIDHLDYVVATHPDTDHTGGIAGALEVATAGRAFCSVTSAEQRSFNAMADRLSAQNVALEVPEVGDSWALGSALVQIIGPVSRTDDGDANNDSIMLKITYGSTVFVFAGDADEGEEKGGGGLPGRLRRAEGGPSWQRRFQLLRVSACGPAEKRGHQLQRRQLLRASHRCGPLPPARLRH